MGVAAAVQSRRQQTIVIILVVVVVVGCRGQNESADAVVPASSSSSPMSTTSATTTYYNFRCLDNSNNSYLTILPPGAGSNLVLRASNSVLPQLVARIYAISLQDILKSNHKIQIKPTEPEIHSNDIELTMWMMPDYHLHFEYQNLGPTFHSVGTIGWYIPTKLIGKGDLPDDLPYTMFQGTIDEEILSQFRTDYSTDKKMIELAEQIPGSNDINGHYSYTPSWCSPKDKHYRGCVKLLAGYYEDTTFVWHHIEKFNLSVEVVWFGENLETMVNYLMDRYAQENSVYSDRVALTNRTVSRKFMVLEHSPSFVIDGAIPFSKLRMFSCSELITLETPRCAYSDLPILKAFRDDVLRPHETKFTKRMVFDYKDILAEYAKLLGNSSRSDAILDKTACDYVKKHQKTISSWQLPNEHSSRTTLYRIAVMNKPNSIYGNTSGAADMAIAAVNANTNKTFLSNIVLESHNHNVSCTAYSILHSYLSYHQMSQNLVGILGPPCTSSLEPMSTVSTIFGIPEIMYTATISAFDAINYPYFFRMVAESRFYELALVETMKEFEWHRMAIVTEDGLKKSSYLADYFDAEYPIEVLVHQKMPQLGNDSKVIQDHLKELHARSAKIILLEMYGESALQVMCEARALNMTARNGYVWFLPSWIGEYATTVFNYSTKYSTPCGKAEIEEALDYQFSFHYAQFGDENDFIEHLNMTTGTWVAQYKKSMNLGPNDTVPDKYTALIFDAVWVFAFALQKVVEKFPFQANLRAPPVGAYLQAMIKETNFVGLSGRVDFRHDQSRRSRTILSQWRSLELREVGREDNGTMHFDVDRIRWWGDGGGAPSDGRIICSVEWLARALDIECDAAVITITILVSFVGAILASVVFYMYWRRFYNEKMKVSAQVMRNLGIDLLNTSRAPENLLGEWEIPKEQIMLNRKLGEGAFGTVYGGQAYINGSQDLQAVAVKSLKAGSTDEDRYDFLAEAEAMKRFQHPNILKLLGVCLQSEPIFTVIEFMLYGDLKTYLLARRHLVKDKIPDDSDVSAKRLTAMTMDIVRGLVYLAEQKYVHRDIACRNCLVNADRKVKIGDFGMARPTGSNDYYRFNRKGLLPVRWLSPESLSSGFFTPASDIWSFGVLIFEIISFGAFPYQGLSNNEVLEFVKIGNSMNIPEGLNPKLERLLKTCWEPDYKKRPTAVQILEFIGNNPRIIAPSCIDIPQFSVQFSDCESDQLEFTPSLNQSPDSGIGGMGRPITRETLQELAAMPTSQAAADAFQMRMNAAALERASGKTGTGRFLMGNGGGGAPNGNLSLTYNPIEPLLLRQNSNDMSSSSSSLLRYVPMCGFGSKRTTTPNYTNHNPDGSADDSEYTRMSVTEF